MGRDAARELVLTVALPEDRGRRGDARPKVHRFRSHWAELGRRLRAFRARYGLTQAEVARAVGAEGHSTVALWENGARVPANTIVVLPIVCADTFTLGLYFAHGESI